MGDWSESWQRATEAVQAAVDLSRVSEAVARQGHALLQLRRIPEAMTAFEEYLSWDPVHPDAAALWRLARLYQGQGNIEQQQRALQLFCEAHPDTCSGWFELGCSLLQPIVSSSDSRPPAAAAGAEAVGAARSQQQQQQQQEEQKHTRELRLLQIQRAARALMRANQLDRTRSDVWGWLAWVSLLQERVTLADQCVNFATRLGFSDSDLIKKIASQYDRLGHSHKAKAIQSHSSL